MSSGPLLRDSCRAYRYIIGLTGSIASGKSHAREYLASLGAVAVDADRLGHAAYRRGTPCYDAVVREFSPAVVGADGAFRRGCVWHGRSCAALVVWARPPSPSYPPVIPLNHYACRRRD
jgi:hypothetical protein